MSVAPSPTLSSAERAIVDLWRSLLKRDVGLDDDFFALGGDSVMAAQVSNAIHRSFGVELSPVVFFEAVTARALAHRIEEAARPVTRGDTRAPIYFMPAGDGEVFAVRELIALLEADRPVTGLRIADDDPLPASMEDLAAGYVARMTREHTGIPFHVVGFCFGGLLAYEVARQLHVRGERVGLVSIISQHTPGYRNMSGLPSHLGELVRSFGPRARDLATAPPRETLETSRRLMRHLLQRAKLVPRTPFVPPRAMRIGLDEAPERVRSTVLSLLSARDRYVPKPSPLRIQLLREDRHPLMSSHDPELGWGGIALGGVDLQVLAGSHTSQLRAPHVSVVRDAIRAELTRSEARLERAPARAAPPSV